MSLSHHFELLGIVTAQLRHFTPRNGLLRLMNLTGQTGQVLKALPPLATGASVGLLDQIVRGTDNDWESRQR